MSLLDAWVALRHGGNLLAPPVLDSLPQPGEAPWGLADRLRTALVSLDPDKLDSPALGTLLDVVLEDVCGLKAGWVKGSGLGSADGEKLLDGTVLKPRRLFFGPNHETLGVFSTGVKRLGVGKGRRAVAHSVEYLRRRSISLGLITNGMQWRLIWADVDSLAWVEWEAERWINADQLSAELALLRVVLSASSLARAVAEDPTSLSPLLAAIRDTRRGQARLSKELGERVRRAVETLLRSREPLVGPAWKAHASNDLYVGACKFVMRLVVTLFAEARELLPIDNPIYYQVYGLRGLLDQLDRLTPERRRSRHSAWPRLLALFRLLHQGSPHPALSLPAYGGDLFRPEAPDGGRVQRAVALLETLTEPPDDDVVHRILILLTRTTQKVREGSGWRTVAAPVDFTELTSEYIGILYEGLLDYELHRAGEQPIVFLNLGDQPALPLDRLEAMDDKALRALVEKAKVKKQSIPENVDDSDSDEDEDDVKVVGEEDDDGDIIDEAVVVEFVETTDDARAKARTRALAWGRRAAEVANLVKKPKGKSKESAAVYAVQLDSSAMQLIADLKLPGELYLVRWGGTRKGAGTFYTRPQLTLPTVRRTLEPLVYGNAETGATAGEVLPPEALLALKVCDPAMGSGSFLVAALRVLTGVLVESLHIHKRINRVNGRTSILCDALPEADRSLPTEGFDERLEAIVRRAVVEHCLYGVDIDPLAVELARVALWVETLDRRLPFTFLDHKLRCGDALIGTWLDRFRDYPLLCFERKSPDEKYVGVNHKGDTWHNSVKERRAAAISEQVDLLAGQLPLETAATSDEELKAAVARVRRLYRDLRAVPAGRPDERARIWRQRIQTDPALVRVRESFDAWCALWFWPLDQLDLIPLPSELHAPTEAARAVINELRERRRFFHWELEFPDVFTEEGAGFNAVVGNPPWENEQPNPKEYFSNTEPLFRHWGRLTADSWIEGLFKSHPTEEYQWLKYMGHFKDTANWVRNASAPFGAEETSLPGFPRAAWKHWHSRIRRHQGTSRAPHPFRLQEGRVFTYRLFAEASLSLCRDGGRLGILLPSGIYSDAWSEPIRRALVEQNDFEWLYSFENRRKVFDIDSRFKFCVVVVGVGGSTAKVKAAFMRTELEDWSRETPPHMELHRELLNQLSPTTLSIPEIRDPQDLSFIERMFTGASLLGEITKSSWRLTFNLEFMMNIKADRFPPIADWTARGYRVEKTGLWAGPNGHRALPLYQGTMVGQFDFSQKGWRSGKGRGAVWEDIPWVNKTLQPQFLMAEEVYFKHKAGALAKVQDRLARENQATVNSLPPIKIGFMDIGSATNTRTMTATLLPDLPCGNKVPVFYGEAAGLPLVVAFLNSFAFDAQLRLKLTGTTLNYFIVAQTPLPRRDTPGAVRLAPLVCQLAMVGHIFAPAWLELRRAYPTLFHAVRWAVTAHERLRLRCMVDAIVATLYRLNREDFSWILKDCDHPAPQLSDLAFCRQLDPKGFWRVDKTQDPELRHTVLSLAAFDDLQACIAGAGGDCESGVNAFCDQHDGEGWMLPETLCIADLCLTRTVCVGQYEKEALPVRSRLGERFLDWQLAQTPEESWAECERHAMILQESHTARPPEIGLTRGLSAVPVQGFLPGMED